MKKPVLVCYERELNVNLRHSGPFPGDQIDLFLVVYDNGFPFLLGFTRKSSGMEIRYNSYINPSLENDLRVIKVVNVVEAGAGYQRAYSVPLLHSFD